MVIKIILTLFTGYLLGVLLLYIIQDKIIFQPDVLDQDFQFEFQFDHHEYFFNCPSGNTINALYFPTKHKRKGIIFYHHGNSQDLSLWGYEAEPGTRLGYDVFMYDYPTYGKSFGSLSSDKLFSDGQYLLQWLKTNYQNTPIILYGRSLGTGIAAKIAAEDHSISKVILETPYYSMTQMAQTFVSLYPMNLILRFKIKTYEYLSQITCPIYLLHGDYDELIPLKQAKKLEKKNKLAELTIIKGGSHNDLPFHKQFREKIFQILK